jgi:hypothetical protein
VRVGIAIVVGTSLLGFAGCGTEASERDARRVVERFEQALERRDGASACAQLTTPTRVAVARDAGRSCASAVIGLDLPPAGEVTDSDVYLTSGFVRASRSSAFLDQTSRGWRISAAACRPTRPGMPYDCELSD